MKPRYLARQCSLDPTPLGPLLDPSWNFIRALWTFRMSDLVRSHLLFMHEQVYGVRQRYFVISWSFPSPSLLSSIDLWVLHNNYLEPTARGRSGGW
jgi:hypothetical protein